MTRLSTASAVRSRPRDRAATGVALALLNVPLAAFVGRAWLAGTPTTGSIEILLFSYGALVSTVAMLALCLALPLVLVTCWLPSRAAGWLSAAAWTLFQLFVFADTKVYGLFRYHFNGSIWNVLTTPGGEDAVHIGWGDWLPVVAVGIVLLGLELAAWSWLAHKRRGPRPARPLWQRPLPIGFALVLMMLVTEKSIYAKADLLRDRAITSRSRMYPFYKRFTVKRLADSWFDYDLAERPRVDVSGSSLTLRYPIAHPKIDPAGPRPNILIVVIDSLRRDMLAAETMPRVAEWSRGARRFDAHVSSGNATRFGLFALIYGLHGAYWMPIYGDQRPPVLVEVLSELGYDMRVLSSASMSYPEFRSTAWVTIEEHVEDDYPEHARNKRDEHLAERFDAWLAERAGRAEPQPFFAFCLLDSPHQPYWVAPDLTPFEPYSERIDYLDLAGNPGQEAVDRVRNRYKNAVAHADRVTGRLLDSLARHGEAQETLVIVTGDHGEEFFEHGHFGHTSDFTLEQVGVPFLLGGPGVPPGVEHRATSHVDLPATLLGLLGADPAAREDWSLGYDLLAPPESRLLVVAGWDELGLIVDGGILYLPLEGHKGSVEAYLPDWTPHPQEDEFLRANAAATSRLLLECRRFLR